MLQRSEPTAEMLTAALVYVQRHGMYRASRELDAESIWAEFRFRHKCYAANQLGYWEFLDWVAQRDAGHVSRAWRRPWCRPDDQEACGGIVAPVVPARDASACRRQAGVACASGVAERGGDCEILEEFFEAPALARLRLDWDDGTWCECEFRWYRTPDAGELTLLGDGTPRMRVIMSRCSDLVAWSPWSRCGHCGAQAWSWVRAVFERAQRCSTATLDVIDAPRPRDLGLLDPVPERWPTHLRAPWGEHDRVTLARNVLRSVPDQGRRRSRDNA